MRLVDLTHPERKDVSIQDVANLKDPYMLFLGGLFHVQDIDTQKGFPGFLRKLRGDGPARIFLALDETVTDTADLTNYMFAYGRNDEQPSGFMREIYDTLIRPHVEATDFTVPAQRDVLKQNLSRMGLVGYSYGTSLIQQLAEITAGKIVDAIQGAGIENAGILANDICSAVKAVNIGPVCKFKHLYADGSIDMLEPNDPYHQDASTIFSQMSFLMRDDKIVQRSYGNELLAGVEYSETGIEIQNTRNTTLYIDYVGFPTHAALGYFDAIGGDILPKIITSYDYLIHDLRTYMNCREVQGNVLIYPSFAIAPVLREATRTMFDRNELGNEWRQRLDDQFSSRQARESLVLDLFRNRSEFDSALRAFQKAVVDDGVSFLKRHVENARHADNTAQKNTPADTGLVPAP